MYIPQIGDVIKDNGYSVVVVDMKNYETFGSCCYDRQYLFCDLDYLEKNQRIVTMSDLESHGRWVTIYGTKFPEIEKVDSVAPFSIENVECCMIRQKVAKTVTVYE
jgi:hypothetical protein